MADMGAGAGEVAHRWFNSMHEQARDNGVAFTAIGLVTPDPASVSSILTWGDVYKRQGGTSVRESEFVSRLAAG